MTTDEMFKVLIEKVDNVDKKFDELKSDVAELKSDVAELKSDVAELKVRVGDLEKGQKMLFDDQIRLHQEITEVKLNLEKGQRMLFDDQIRLHQEITEVKLNLEKGQRQIIDDQISLHQEITAVKLDIENRVIPMVRETSIYIIDNKNRIGAVEKRLEALEEETSINELIVEMKAKGMI